MFHVKKIAAAAILAIGLPSLVHAADVLLTVSGEVGPSEQGDAWVFTMDELRALPTASFETETIWTDGVQVFEGVALNVLLDHVDAESGTIRATAANDYAITIPFSDAVSGGPIVAYLRNGQEMSLRDKGPLWIVYPFDDNETYKSEEYYSRSIWQLNRIEVVAGE
ncbi:oxidoreductase [Shimia marina]|uniref:Oxidoreductase molybdopterin binding domain protein n=1 Tax=Shimia marina TaxID=321267 RepID=A0A0P1EL76_9RHOB|nr:oxidoreductase [Shimia marina]CUH50883.1 Oxidoreductase molybdopterin binding domain protein [Shimia marina]SFE55798.1 hypothetical protein SAMN04488037_11169 [Shimia marina]